MYNHTLTTAQWENRLQRMTDWLNHSEQEVLRRLNSGKGELSLAELCEMNPKEVKDFSYAVGARGVNLREAIHSGVPKSNCLPYARVDKLGNEVVLAVTGKLPTSGGFSNLEDAFNQSYSLERNQLGRLRSDFERVTASSGRPQGNDLTFGFGILAKDGSVERTETVAFSGTSDVSFLYLPRPCGVYVQVVPAKNSPTGVQELEVNVPISEIMTNAEAWNSSWTAEQTSAFKEILAYEMMNPFNMFFVKRVAERVTRATGVQP